MTDNEYSEQELVAGAYDSQLNAQFNSGLLEAGKWPFTPEGLRALVRLFISVCTTVDMSLDWSRALGSSRVLASASRPADAVAGRIVALLIVSDQRVFIAVSAVS